MRTRNKVGLAFLFVVVLGAIAGVLIACNETPTEVAVRTFERAQRMDVVCLQLYDTTTGQQILPIPQPQDRCNPVATGVNGGALANQLFALVTQSTRGELAVVNLSAGYLQDLSRATPGINFVPVGALPTDVATTPDGKIAFVGSAEPNKPAIYGVSTRRILGDQFGIPPDPEGLVGLPSWPVCSLPQNPGAMAVVARRAQDADGGTTPDGVQYELVVVLNGDRRSSAKIVTVDARPFLRQIDPVLSVDGAPAARPDQWWGAGPTLGKGQLEPCPITSAIEISGREAIPGSFQPGTAWPDGVPYVDGGVDLSCDQPSAPGTCGVKACDGGAPAADAGSADAGNIALALGPLDDPRLASAALDDQFLYVADANLPLVHVIDLSVPGSPQELPPFVATSIADPSHVVSIASVAVSPPTRDYKRYLYAVDKTDGSILVYDVTDPKTAVRSPMRRPHPELDPFQPEDRISFTTPAVAISFVRHDFPLSRINGAPIPNAKSGWLCNPNPNLDRTLPDGGPRTPAPPTDYGFYYRNDNSTDPDAPLGPRRLRGIFAFATLANGQILAIDVDDWDAPCRRPAQLASPPTPSVPRTDSDAGILALPPIGALAQPQPSSGDTDYDPYHAPFTDPSSTSEEISFPIIQPHRVRSDSYFSENSQTGNRVPRLNGVPRLLENGVPLPFVGPGAEKTPLVMPANQAPPPVGSDPGTDSLGVQFSIEAPEIHADQDWTLTYEGTLPGFDGISATISTTDGYASVVLTQPNGRFCAKGVEDWELGRDRASRVVAELHQRGLRAPGDPLKSGGAPVDELSLDRQIVDYVQLTEDLLDPGDPYWAETDDPGQCWDPSLTTAGKKYDACAKTFGNTDDPTNVSPARDYPILEAYQDHVVLGTFAAKPDGTRDVVYKDASYNAARLKLMRCCFHHQVRFHVRTGGVWSLLGYAPGQSQLGIGFLSHLTTGAAGRCVASCEPRQALLNARAPAVPNGRLLDPNAPAGGHTLTFGQAPGRNSALAVRNPFFSLWTVDGVLNDSAPPRDTQYFIPARGSFSPLLINLAAGTTEVSPQSMRFIETLGQLAVVDAQSQGLVLIDLSNVAIAHNPYF